MEITDEKVSELLTEIQRNALPLSKTTEENFCPGAVWHGDWADPNKTVSGRFGESSSKKHFAMVLWGTTVKPDRMEEQPGIEMAPITSKKHSNAKSVRLPPDELRTSSNKAGWILPKFKLLVRKRRLQQDFEFKQFLPEKYVDQCREVLQDG